VTRCATNRLCFSGSLICNSKNFNVFAPNGVAFEANQASYTMSAPPPGLFVASLLLLGLAVLIGFYF
jgi:hypothetical protein